MPVCSNCSTHYSETLPACWRCGVPRTDLPSNGQEQYRRKNLEIQMQSVAAKRALGDDGHGAYRVFIVISLSACMVLLLILVAQLSAITDDLINIYDRMGQMRLY